MRSRPAASDAALNLALGALGVILAFAAVLHGGGVLAARLTGTAPPATSLAAALAVLADPAHPGAALGTDHLSTAAYWVTTGLVLAVIGATGSLLGRWIYRRRRAPADPRALPGLAGGYEVARVASERRLRRRAATLRPSLGPGRVVARDVGYLLGRAHGRGVWATVEDSMLLVGPPRSGKGLHGVIPMILDAPGAVITTSTRPDNLATTLRARQQQGPVAVFDPQQLAAGVPAGLRWSPVRGCTDPLTAMIRATGLSASVGFGGVEDGGFWQGKTTAAIQALLHAAALDERGAGDLYRWSLNPSVATEAVRILQNRSQAAAGWAESLEAMIQADPRTRDSIWQGVSLAFGALADPRVLAALSPGPGESFDPESFLRERGTLYLLATGSGAGASAGLVAAFVEDLVEVARRMAARSPGARLDPPLLLALDEIGNLAPLPSLPILMAEGGGTGVTVLTVLQSLAQARDRWSEHAASAIWDAAIVKILLGGQAGSRDLQDLTTLIGERDENTDSLTIDTFGGRSTQRSVRRVPIMPPDLIRSLPFGVGLVLLRSARPIAVDLTPWVARKDAAFLKDDRARMEEMLRIGA